MSKIILTILFAFCLTSAINAYGVGGYGNYGNFGDYTKYYNFGGSTGAAGDTKNPQNTACANSLANINRAFTQLAKDIKDNVPQWILIQSLDAVNEVSYFIKNTCKTTLLELRNAGAIGLNITQDEACSKLSVILENLLEENQASSFRGGFEATIDTAIEVEKLAPGLGDNCNPQLVVKGEAFANTQGQANVNLAQPEKQSVVSKLISSLFSSNPLLQKVRRHQTKVDHVPHRHQLHGEERPLNGEDDLVMSHHTHAFHGESDLMFNQEDLFMSHRHRNFEADLMFNHEDLFLGHHRNLELNLFFDHEDVFMNHHHRNLESELMFNHEDLFMSLHHRDLEADLFMNHHHRNLESELMFNHEDLFMNHHRDFESDLMFNHEDLFMSHHVLDDGEYALDFYTVNKKGNTDSGSQWMGGDYQRYNDPTFWQKGGYARYYNGNGQSMYGVPASLTTPTANKTAIEA